MRQKRYIAPWSRKAVEVDLDEATLAALAQKPAIYHCITRVAGQLLLFGRAEKDEFVEMMRAYESFCQVRVLTFCVMTNHVHLLVEVPEAPEDRGASWTDEEFFNHVSTLYYGLRMNEIRWRLEHYRSQGWDDLAEEFRNTFFARMWDLSGFMKGLNQRFAQWYNREHGRTGHLWGDRFKSVLVEDGLAARTMAAYIDLNPVRADMVGDPKDYRWSGYGESVAGGRGARAARAGLQRVLFEYQADRADVERAAEKVQEWEEVARAYRMILFEDGEQSGVDAEKGRSGISSERVAQVMSEGGKLSEREALRCRVRHFVDGMVVGSESFVNAVFELTRRRFGEKRKNGARKLRGVDTELRTMRDLQKDTLSK
jgi:REP element-mobilizing transposase RayT